MLLFFQGEQGQIGNIGRAGPDPESRRPDDETTYPVPGPPGEKVLEILFLKSGKQQ